MCARVKSARIARFPRRLRRTVLRILDDPDTRLRRAAGQSSDLSHPRVARAPRRRVALPRPRTRFGEALPNASASRGTLDPPNRLPPATPRHAHALARLPRDPPTQLSQRSPGGWTQRTSALPMADRVDHSRSPPAGLVPVRHQLAPVATPAWPPSAYSARRGWSRLP